MQVQLNVKKGSAMAAIHKTYSDLDWDDEYETWFIGDSSDEKRDYEWMTYNEAVEFCGFCEGANPTASVMIEGNGGWAQSMISRRDFSGLAISEAEKRSYKRTSNRFWRAYKRGQEAAKKFKRSKPKRKLCAA